MDETVYDTLMGAALRFVSYRPRSEKELRDFCTKTLKRHHTTAPLVIERVLARLRELGYADDEEFMNWWVTQRTSSTPKGKRRIISELMSKGIAHETIDAYFSKKNNAIDDYALATQAIENKLGRWKQLPTEERKKKLYGFLTRRGFDADSVHRIVDDMAKKE